MKKITITLVFFSAIMSSNIYAWEGVDNDSGSDIEIESGNLVRAGEEIEYYDHDYGEYRSADVESVESSGSGAEVEVYDHESGEYRTFEME